MTSGSRQFNDAQKKNQNTMKKETRNRLRCPLLAFALAAGILGPARLVAVDPDLPFASGSTGADGPLTFRQIAPGRNSHAMAYDPVRKQVVLFGGHNGAGLGDTWSWDGTNWVRFFPANSPPDRWNHGMVWDAARQEVVLFGGTRSTGRLNDTWTWNGTNWTQESPASSPSPRESFCMAYDAARQRVVIFAGAGGNQETWLWNGTDWTQANPANRPQATSTSAMAYDPARQECVLFGNYGQTWIWNGTDWTQRGSLHTPAGTTNPALIQDGTSNTILLFSGSNRQETWSWNGTDWTLLSPTTSPAGRQYHAMVWDSDLQRGVMFGGAIPGVSNYGADTWFWNGTDWSLWSDNVQWFDLSARPDGIYNFTTINVPGGVTVRFISNVGNTPVRWLASDNVVINGALDVGGELGANSLPPGVPAKGGPGGYAGGRGGIRFSASTSYVGQPGLGPAGGDPGTAPQTSPVNLRDGEDGQFIGEYGNAFLYPLDGGSGGGGGASSDTIDGGNGGGGGGAILISSSRDIQLNGAVRANGGFREWSGASYGGRGSGGSILLRADRVTGPGSLEAYGGQNNNPNGRIRVEAYVRTLTGGAIPVAVVGLPSANGELNQVGTLTIVSVDGANVVQPPSGNPLTPDVVFSDTGAVNIVVNATGIPDGTPVTVRITTSNSVITAGPANLAGGTATVSATVPAGIGTLLASADFTL